MYIGGNYGKKEFGECATDCMRRRGGGGEQFIRWGRRYDCGAVITAYGYVGKECARHGDFGDFTRIVAVLSFVRLAGFLQFCGVDTDLVRGNGGRYFGRANVG